MSSSYYKIRDYINGEWLDAASSASAPLYNPSTGALIGEVPLGNSERSRAATAAAAEAYPAWRDTALPKRMDYLFAMHSAMVANKEMLALAIAEDQAKHIAEARGEVQRVIEILQMACTIPALIQGETVTNIAANIGGRITKAPLGVFCGVAPFMQKMMEVLESIGLPKGVVNIVHGDREVVEAWYDDENVAGACLVGSSPTAKAIAEGCGRNGKKTMLLGGAKNFLAVMEDAPMDLLIENVLMSGYGSAGQRCLAVSNIACVESIHDEFVERLLAASKGVTLGDAMNPDVFMGPVISAAAKQRIEGYIQQGIDAGATLALDGRQPALPEANREGYFVGPTVFTDVTPCMNIAREEIFGPVLSVMKVGCIDGALRMIKNHPMGNGACIFTQNAYYIEKFINQADVGMVGVNVGICAPHPYMPFGGIKDSLVGNNKVQGKEGIDFFTQNKVATVRVVDPKAGQPAATAADSGVRSCVAS